MADVKARLTVDPLKGVAAVTLEMAGHTELEHDLILEFFGRPRSVSLVPFRKGDEIEARFTISDPDAPEAAQESVENRKRVREGREVPALKQSVEVEGEEA